MKFLNAKLAQQIDIDLFTKHGFSVDQLMELAGLSVAHAITKEFPSSKYTKVAVLCGPGNNGGDGLVAARHLKIFGYSPSIFYPKPTDKPLFKGLLKQCESFSIPFETDPKSMDTADLVIDAIFGFSFKGEIRVPFDCFILKLSEIKVPVVSVDIPSGWDVDNGNISHLFTPNMLISLTLPKLCAKEFKGIHYLGGRFIPKIMVDEYGLEIPDYPGIESCVKISN